MYLKTVVLDEDSYIEISDRDVGGNPRLQIIIRGKSGDEKTLLVSALLNNSQTALVKDIFTDWCKNHMRE